MDRRKFIKLSTPLAISPFVVNGFPMRAFANKQLAGAVASCDGVSERVLVIVQLRGGNDGLNTVIPLSFYDTYANIRPNLRLMDTGVGALIPLDSTLPNNKQVGLHPSLTGFKSLYDSGKMSVVQGVGYENMNRSHFKGTDLWLTGGDATIENNQLKSGWMGRALQSFYPDITGAPTPEMPDPLGIQVGNPTSSLGFHTETEHQNMINLSGQDPAGFFSLIQTIGGSPLLNIPDSDYGDEIAYILNVENSVSAYAERITAVFNAGSNVATYPNTPFANQLKTVARLIKGGCKTKIFHTELGGFDTHSNQVLDGEPHVGDHADLLATLSQAIEAFMSDVESLGLADRVAAVTFSEFGRKAVENGSSGCDHGTLAPLFVFGKHIDAGVKGQNANLDNLTGDMQLQGMEYDYRQVFTTLLQDFLGADAGVLQDTLFEGYDKINLIDAAAVVSPDCYLPGASTGVSTLLQTKSALSFSPSPATYYAEANFTAYRSGAARMRAYNLAGQLVQEQNLQLSIGDNNLYLDTANFPPGHYAVTLESSQAGVRETAQVVVVR